MTVALGYECLNCAKEVCADEGSIVLELVGMQLCMGCVGSCVKE